MIWHPTEEARRNVRANFVQFLPLWVVYRNPLDYPGRFVTRCQYAIAGTEEVRPCRVPSYVGGSLDEARDAIPPDAVCIGREPGDEIQIVEVWL